jgi:hypothetical protein
MALATAARKSASPQQALMRQRSYFSILLHQACRTAEIALY